MDQTGYGPSAFGRNPTNQEAILNARTKAQTKDNINYALQNNPMLEAMVVRILQAGSSKQISVDEARKIMRNEASGRLVTEAAYQASKLLNPKMDPIQSVMTTANAVRGTSIGGSVIGEQGNRIGSIAFRGPGLLSTVMEKELIRDLNRNAYTDTGKENVSATSGMGISSYAAARAELIKNGALKDALVVKQDASLSDRLNDGLAAATGSDRKDMQSALSSDRARSSISKINELYRQAPTEEVNEKIRQEIEEFKKISGANDKTTTLITSLAKARDSVTLKQDDVKKLNNATRALTKGMAVIDDMFDGLSGTDNLAMLSSMVGKSIDNNNASVALRRAREMRSGATLAGVSAEVYGQANTAAATNSADRIAQGIGVDLATSKGLQTSTSAGIRAYLDRNVGAYKNFAESNNMNDNEADIRNRLAQGMENYSTQFTARTVSLGARENMTGAQRKELDALTSEFDSADSREGRTAAETKLRSFYERKYGTSWDKIVKTGEFNKDLSNTFSGKYDYQLRDMVDKTRLSDVNTTHAEASLKSAGAKGDTKSAAKVLQTKLGGTGLLELIRMQQGEGGESVEQRLKMLTGQAGMTDDEAKNIDQLIGSISKDDATAIAKGMQNSNAKYANNFDKQRVDALKWSADKTAVAERGKYKLDIEKSSGGLTGLVKHVAENALGLGDKDALDNDYIKMQMLQAYQKDYSNDTKRQDWADTVRKDGKVLGGEKIVNELGNLDKDGLSADALASLKRNGVDLGKDLGMTDEELINKSRTDPGIKSKIMESLNSNENITLAGTADSLIFANKKQFESIDTSKAQQRLKEKADINAIFGSSDGSENTVTMADGGLRNALAYEKVGHNKTWLGGRKNDGTIKSKNLDQFFKAANRINERQDISGLASADGAEEMLDRMRKMRQSLENAYNENGQKPVKVLDSNGMPLKNEKGEDLIAGSPELQVLKEAIDKMAKAVDEAKGRKTAGEIKEMNQTIQSAVIHINEPNFVGPPKTNT